LLSEPSLLFDDVGVTESAATQAGRKFPRTGDFDVSVLYRDRFENVLFEPCVTRRNFAKTLPCFMSLIEHFTRCGKLGELGTSPHFDAGCHFLRVECWSDHLASDTTADCPLMVSRIRRTLKAPTSGPSGPSFFLDERGSGSSPHDGPSRRKLRPRWRCRGFFFLLPW
jgi:hypothetical protein